VVKSWKGRHGVKRSLGGGDVREKKRKRKENVFFIADSKRKQTTSTAEMKKGDCG